MIKNIDKKQKIYYNVESSKDFLIESLDLKEQQEIDNMEYLEYLQEQKGDLEG